MITGILVLFLGTSSDAGYFGVSTTTGCLVGYTVSLDNTVVTLFEIVYFTGFSI